MKQRIRLAVRSALVGGFAGLSMLTVATDALAGVGNPGYFEFTVPSGYDSALWFGAPSGDPMDLSGGGTGYFFADIDAAGDASGIGSSFPAKTYPGGIPAKLEFRSTSTGTADPASQVLDFNMQARVRFTSGGTTCYTANFAIHLSTTNWSPTTQGVCSVGYDENSGEFCMAGGGFTIPTLPSSACNNTGNTINSTFALGTSNTYIQILKGVVAPYPITH